MNPIDAHISLFFSTLAGHHPTISTFLYTLSGSYFFRGQVMILAFFWVWFYPGPERHTRREVLMTSLVACVLALAIGRVMVSALPVRVRPNDNPVFHFSIAYSAKNHPESSFPSDHAILFAALATGIFLASRRVGTLALAYVATLICFPRLWIGFHFFSDLLVGACIGVGLVLLFNRKKVRATIARPLCALFRSRPHFFYTGLFLFCFQVSEMFDPARDLLAYLRSHGNLVISMLGH